MALVQFPVLLSYVCGLSLLVLRVFPRVLWFSPLTKNQHFKLIFVIQFDL